MPELQLDRTSKPVCVHMSRNGGDLSVPERELLNFIDSVASLVGHPVSTRILTEIWLDELAGMDCSPEPTHRGWRIVSLRRRRAWQIG